MAWIDLKVPWHNTDVNYCDVTGNLVVGKCWEFTDKENGEVCSFNSSWYFHDS